ncbi:hypothetical protein NM688_g3286 [Phlebia brevispora]|uniref:Uncharacterized protein n=1 Tax=Phlebia brevispora TaxID=194682 RepID=A0ACC1T5Y2_9APHY|nr:hypothetical protein NM688_g3286 [Phlebia brevispora]
MVAAAFCANRYAANRTTSYEEDAKNEQEDPFPQADPWATIDRTVRGQDESKVHDCKEDMDTLLVFADLNSAVLTSFLVQSYQNLLEDPQQTTVDLLRQVSLQTSSYTFINGHLNSSASSGPSLAPFQATILDIRVNVCWFASLILSLSTASFGILVKQSLREYLAVDYTAPQERIRIRHFRARGLEDWKLFEIAAALTLVLQLPLALFFVGLCFFTAEIHPTVRATSISLVSGWAVLFGFTGFPTPSTICSRACVPLAFSLLASPIRYMAVMRLFRGPFLGRRTAEVPDRCATVSIGASSAQQAWQDGTDATRHLDEFPAASLRIPLSKNQIIERILREYILKEDVTILAEEKVRVSDNNDLAILKNVDGLFQDDDLLNTTPSSRTS